MLLSAITAIAQNNVIGKNNQLPWHLPADMRYFKNTTMGHVVIMGRKTYESFTKALPGRTNIVVTRQKGYQPADALVVHSLDEAVNLAKAQGETEAFILGGAQIYAESMPLLDRLYLTRIYADFEGDTVFPEFDPKQWEMTAIRPGEPDEKNKYFYAFQTWERKGADRPV